MPRRRATGESILFFGSEGTCAEDAALSLHVNSQRDRSDRHLGTCTSIGHILKQNKLLEQIHTDSFNIFRLGFLKSDDPTRTSPPFRPECQVSGPVVVKVCLIVLCVMGIVILLDASVEAKSEMHWLLWKGRLRKNCPGDGYCPKRVEPKY